MNHHEREAQKAIVEWLELVLPRGSRIWATVNENHARAQNALSRARYGERMKAFGLRKGAPDLTICVQKGLALFIETKRQNGGVVSVEQQQMHADLRAAGHKVEVCVDIESARAFLQECGVKLNEAAGQLARKAVVRNARPRPSLNDPMPF